MNTIHPHSASIRQPQVSVTVETEAPEHSPETNPIRAEYIKRREVFYQAKREFDFAVKSGNSAAVRAASSKFQKAERDLYAMQSDLNIRHHIADFFHQTPDEASSPGYSAVKAEEPSLPTQQQVIAAVKQNPRLIDPTQVRAIVRNSLNQLLSIEHRIDKMENQGFLGRLWGGLTGSNQREMLSLMRDLTYAQQTTIKLVLTLAMCHAHSVAVIDEILDELDKAKGVHTRTASHIELLYEQVVLIKEMQNKQPTSNKLMKGILIGGVISATVIGVIGYLVLKLF
ncbi:hypothetical protein [Brevibacillus sp. NL20B1]|jgi:hypothetical protein|uniref:hypothetical protein n=1 Tax=Brevibacillus sp. NL20B1 TaxID=2829799 RepID=UPI001B8F6C47|nr:hypothetical protein [Brevibacillus sp. NL20B1]MBR8661779.1 hypothetical protein [Brevibacillus sp. NL20B1]